MCNVDTCRNCNMHSFVSSAFWWLSFVICSCLFSSQGSSELVIRDRTDSRAWTAQPEIFPQLSAASHSVQRVWVCAGTHWQSSPGPPLGHFGGLKCWRENNIISVEVRTFINLQSLGRLNQLSVLGGGFSPGGDFLTQLVQALDYSAVWKQNVWEPAGA